MPVRPTLLHRMALVSFILFRKNLGNLREFFGQIVYRPPLTKNCPYAYVGWSDCASGNLNKTSVREKFTGVSLPTFRLC